VACEYRGRNRGRQARGGGRHAGRNPARAAPAGGVVYVVTGGAGFIGANLVVALNARGIRDVLVVDELKQGEKFRNLVDCEIADYLDKREFLRRLQTGGRWRFKAVLHQGACSDTLER